MIKAIFDKEMPECCGECDFEAGVSNSDGSDVHIECDLTRERITEEESRTVRHHKCPLSEA